MKKAPPAGTRAILTRVALSLLFPLAALPGAFAETPPVPAATGGGGVLLLLSTKYGYPAYDQFVTAFAAEFAAEGGSVADRLHIEYLGLGAETPPAKYVDSLSSFIAAKYGAARLDLVIAMHNPATEFFLGRVGGISPGVPLMALYLSQPVDFRGSGRPVAQLIRQQDYAGTFLLARALLPGAQKVLLVSGASAVDLQFRDNALAALEPWKVVVETTDGLSMDAIRGRVAAEAGAIILYATLFEDAGGRTFTAVEAARLVAAAAKGPVFGCYDALLDAGVAGGSMTSYADDGREMAKIAARAARGERVFAAGEATALAAGQKAVFEWPALAAHGLDPNRLPAGTLVLHRPPSAWELFRTSIIGAAAAFAALAAFLVVLLGLNARLRAARRSLAASEGRLRTILDTISDSITITRVADPTVLDANTKLAGFAREELVGRSTVALGIWPSAAERERFVAAFERAGALVDYEATLRRKDGSSYVASISASPIDYGDEPCMLAVTRDISGRKRAEGLVRKRLELLEGAVGLPAAEILRIAVDLIEELTGSAVGFAHVVSADGEEVLLRAWSTATLGGACGMRPEGAHYPVAAAGAWADCARTLEPVVHNDYASLPGRKGLPPGHVPLARELVVPVLRDSRVVAIVGVGNKPTDYTAEDAEVAAYFADVAWEVAERRAAEEAIERSLAEKEVLIHEIHHRTKNALQVIQSLVSLEASRHAGEAGVATFAEKTTGRISAIALVHRLLYEGRDLSKVSFRAYVEELVEAFLRGMGTEGVAVDRSVADVPLLIDVAVPLGIILNELLTNSVKHAFAGREGGRISIRFAPLGGDEYELGYEDDGPGFPPDHAPRRKGSLGLTIVDQIGRGQLRGELSISGEGRFRMALTFSEAHFRARV